MFQTLIKSFKNPEVRRKIIITLLLLLIYRLGCWLPIPGIDASVYTTSSMSDDTLLGLLSAIGGGALQNGAFLAVGIAPYINASIIIQLLTMAIPYLEKLSKQGDEGKRKLTQITRAFTLVLAFAQSVGIVMSWSNNAGLMEYVFGAGTPEILIGFFVCVILVAGTAFTMWLGERITDLGVSNGISLLIFIGILSTAGMSIVHIIGRMFGGDQFAFYELSGFFLLVIAIFGLIVWVDLAERRIPVQYAKQIKGRKQYGGQNTNIPIKINASGVMPIIFAMALITFPQLLCSIFWPTSSFYAWYMQWVGTGTVIYYVLVGLLILFFSYFYAQIQFNPVDVAQNIQNYGGFIPGIRAGKPTSDYLAKISNRLTLFGAIFLTFIAIVPAIIFSLLLDSSLVNAFSATGLLIVVSVALEFDKQLESQLLMKHFKGFLK